MIRVTLRPRGLESSSGRWCKPLICAFLLALSVTAVSGAVGIFEGEGWGTIEGPDTNPARRKALKKALQQAVEDAVGSLLPQKVFVDSYDDIETKITKYSKKYVDSYTVIAEAKEENRYRVEVQAKIKLDELRADLVSIGLLLPRDKIPKWIIITPDIAPDGAMRSQWLAGDGGVSVCEAALGDMIRQYGFRVAVLGPGSKRMSGDEAKGLLHFINSSPDAEGNPLPYVFLEFAKSSGANYLLLGRGRVRHGEGLSGPEYVLGTVELKLAAVDLSNGKTIARLSRRAAVQNIGDDGLDGRALRMAVNRARKELFAAFDTVNPAGSAAGLPIVKITFKGVNTYGQYSAIDKALKKDIQGVRSVKILKLAPGEMALEVKFAGDPETLIALLEKYPFDAVTLRKKDSGEEDSYLLIVE